MMFRIALRSLRRSPGFTAIALVSLALGLGANTALFSLLNAVTFRPLPFHEVERLVDVSEDNPAELCAGCAVGTSFPTYTAWKAAARSFDRLEAYLEQPFSLATGEAPAERVSGALVSSGLLETLGVAPALGRSLLPADDRAGAPGVVVLSHRLWSSRFGGDPSVLGRSVRLNGEPRTVVGVMPASFGFPEFAKLWTPIAGQLDRQAADDRSVGVVGRLAPGVLAPRADAELAGIASTMAAEQPATHRGWIARTSPLERPLADTGANTGFALALAAAGLVLLIACANLANLLLARGAARSRETAVRVALGAGRGDVIRLHLAESLLLATIGGALGIVVGVWAVRAVVATIGTEIPVWIDLAFDWRVYGFALVLAIATGVAVGLVPALEATRTDVQTSLRSGVTTTVSRRESRLRNSLAVAQITLALVLLTGTGLIVKSFLVARRIDNLGHDPRGVLRAEVRLLEARYQAPERVAATAEAVLDRVAAVPGVTAVAVEHMEFLGSFVGHASRVFLDGEAEAVPLDRAPRFGYAVSPDFFAVERIPIQRGRIILPSDRAGSPLVAVVNAVTADRLWPGLDPIGKRFRIDDGPGAHLYTVVGVVGNIVATLGRTAPSLVYTAFAQAPGRPITIQLRTGGDPTRFAQPLVAAVRAVDPDQPIERLMTGEEYLATSLASIRFMMNILGTLGALALLLASFGLYGVLAYLVARRTKELGIRMALGAAAEQVVGLVLGRGYRLVGIAVLIGLPLALGLTRLLRSVLFSVSAADPLVFTIVPISLAAVAAVACYVPARRATRIDPVDALRAD